MKKFEITAPEGFEIDEERTIVGNNVVQVEFKEIRKLPENWEKLGEIGGYWINSICNIKRIEKNNAIGLRELDRNTYPTKELAEAAIASAMYAQLLHRYRYAPTSKFLPIAKEYEPKLLPLLELFFGKHARAAFYLGLLLQLRDDYNDGWIANWNDGSEKYVIEILSNNIDPESYSSLQHVLSFRMPSLRDKFRNNFDELIKIAKPLL